MTSAIWNESIDEVGIFYVQIYTASVTKIISLPLTETYTHQLLCIDHIGFVEYDPDLVVVSSKRLNRSSKFIRNIKLVRVK